MTRGSNRSIKTVIMNNTDGYISVCIRVTGRVQGVGFRYWTLRHAQNLGVGGRVSNVSDGSVEALFCGEINAVEEMIQLCSKGPAYCCVESLEIISRGPIAVCPVSFRILR